MFDNGVVSDNTSSGIRGCKCPGTPKANQVDLPGGLGEEIQVVEMPVDKAANPVDERRGRRLGRVLGVVDETGHKRGNGGGQGSSGTAVSPEVAWRG